MSHTLVLTASARRDIREAARWYNRQQKGLAKRFRRQVQEKTDIICENPYLYQIRSENVRNAPLQRFPYLIHYMISDSEQSVIVIAVAHTHRDPKTWEQRR